MRRSNILFCLPFFLTEAAHGSDINSFSTLVPYLIYAAERPGKMIRAVPLGGGSIVILNPTPYMRVSSGSFPANVKCSPVL